MATSAVPTRKQSVLNSAQRTDRFWSVSAASVVGIFLFILCLDVYSPSMHGPFLFDDLFLPFSNAHASDMPIGSWLSGVRPTLMLSYWVNYQSAGTNTSAYHLFNVVVHTLNAILTWLVALRIFALAGIDRRNGHVLAVFSALIFLLHPLQTEAVAYIAGRSESLASCFFLCVFAIFLYRKQQPVSWRVSIGVLLFFTLAVTTKENMLALVPALLLTDVFWQRNGFWNAIRANWRLYVSIAAGTVIGLCVAVDVLSHATSAGFHVQGVRWYEYLFTETRAVFWYIGLFLLPAGQSADHAFPLSHSVTAHGSLFWMAVLMASTAVAVMLRKRFPIASYGWLLFLVVLAPTSSIIPISDAFVERRMYLPILALCFIAAQALSRYDLRKPGTLAIFCAVLCSLAWASYQRNTIWSDTKVFWTDTVRKSPYKSRPYWNLTQAAVAEGRCNDPIAYLQRADATMSRDPYILASWAKVYGCLGRFTEALDKLKIAESAAPKAAAIFELEGLLYGEMGRWNESKAALDKAINIDPRFEDAYASRGLWYESRKEYGSAIADYQMALEMNPLDTEVRQRVARALAGLKQ